MLKSTLILLLFALPLSAQRLKFEDFQHLPGGDCPNSIAISNENLIIAGTAEGQGTVVRALNKATGAPVWSNIAPFCPTMAATPSWVFVRGQHVGFTELAAYSAITGEMKWVVFGIPSSQPTLVPQFAANDNAVVMTDRDSVTTRAFDPVDGHVLWSANIGGHVVIDGFNVYVTTFDQFSLTTTILRSYDARTGNLNWEYVRPNTRILSMVTAPNRLFLGGNFMAALETGSGDVLWQDTTWGGFLGFGRNMLGVANGNTARVYQAESGQLLWSDTAGYDGYAEPIQYRYWAAVDVGEDGVYFAGALGREPFYTPTAFRAYSLDTGHLLYEDIFSPGRTLSLPQTVIRDGRMVYVSGDATFSFREHNYSIRAYEFADLEQSREGAGVVGRGEQPVVSRERVRR